MARLSAISRIRLGKRQVVGLALIAVLLALFVLLNRIPKLDIAREDLAAAGGGVPGRCFQGFCVEYAENAGFLTRWWNFTLTYLRLVAVGMVLPSLWPALPRSSSFPIESCRRFRQVASRERSEASSWGLP